ncbi:MAG: class II aldolase [Methylophilales bacterium 16-45-7]|jgi:L-fuculose-phosphate aldolase|nr:MAG: class II aldolase [Methylophilales bacterium 16-45-7]
MQDTETPLSTQLLLTAQQLAHAGLNKGTSGNVSVRNHLGFLITPSGVPAEALSAEAMVQMGWDGFAEAHKKPSSEWRFHRDILQARHDIHAVVHTHSMFATTLACLHQEIPAFHYMIAVAGGVNIRCAPYALFGSQALSDAAVIALEGRKACLLANHGMIALGRDLTEALAIAIEVENLAEQYWRALQLGNPYILNETEMRDVFNQFKGYGNWADPPK